jgi:hypothetical protein
VAKYDSNGNQLGKGKGKTYGKEQTNRLQKRRENLQQRDGNPFDYSSVPHELVWQCVTVMAALGGALRFGATRDGGALSVGFYLDGDTWTEYVRPQEDVQDYFERTLQDLLTEATERNIY